MMSLNEYPFWHPNSGALGGLITGAVVWIVVLLIATNLNFYAECGLSWLTQLEYLNWFFTGECYAD